MPESRTVKLFKNSTIAMVYQVIFVLSKFVVRTFFVHMLGAEYLGINGLFTNILSVLNLAELGIGTSIVYSMYKPLAEKDTAEIKKYVKAFKSIYAVIGGIIFVIGASLVPFLHVFIKDLPDIGNIRLIYLLFLTDSVSSYYYAHYKSLVAADQKGFVGHYNAIVFTILKAVAQIIILVLLKNFYLYVVTSIISHWTSGFFISLKVKRMYPYLKAKTEERLSGGQIKELIKNSLAIFSHKIGYTVLNSTDNILISMFVGTVIVGYYSNYNMIILTITGMMALIVSSFQATVGNVCAIDSIDKQHDVFLKINFMFFWLYGIFITGLIFAGTPFIKIWVGDKYVLQETVLMVVYLNAFLQGVRQVVAMYTTATGLFYRMRFKPLFEVAINLVASVILAKKLGITGVFLGTLISFIATNLWYEPYILYRYHFKKGIKTYYQNCVLYGLIIIIGIIVNKIILSFIELPAILDFITRCFTSVIVPSVLFLLFFGKTEEFAYLKSAVLGLVRKKGHSKTA